MPEFWFGLNMLSYFIVIVFAIVWLTIPFVLFGIKDRLDRQNLILDEIFKQLGGKVTKEGRNFRYITQIADQASRMRKERKTN